MRNAECLNNAIEVNQLADKLNLKERLRKAGHTQSWLILELRKAGIVVHTSDLSGILNGIIATPKARLVLETSDKILKGENVGCVAL